MICGGLHGEPVASLTDEEPVEFELNKLFLNLIKKVFKGDIDGIDEATTIDNAQTLMDGVFEGFGGDFSAFHWGSPDYIKLAHLERNVYQFSGAKNYQQKQDLTRLIKDGERVRTYKEFRQEAAKILDEYQGNWLKTEYNAAIAGSQMASKWVDMEKHPTSLIQYRTMEDARVRDDHAELNRITRPAEDPFWNIYYPPNGWNCRCTAIRVNDSGLKTSDSGLNYPEIPKMFQVNLGKEGIVFPVKGNPLFSGIPKDINSQINSLIPDHPKP